AGARRQIDAYVSGVNAFVSSHHGSRLPPEFALLRYQPEPWTGEDVLAWVKMMAWDLSGNYRLELLRHDLIARVGAGRTASLLPPYPADGLTIVAEASSFKLQGSGFSKSLSRSPKSEARSHREVVSWSTIFEHGLTSGHPAVADLLLGGTATEAL